MTAGWIKLHRQLQESSFYGQPLAVAIWVECLLRASHDSKERYIGREKVHLNEGEFVMGYREMGEVVGCATSTVKAWLDAFEKDGMVERRANAKGTICKLKKWSEYQDSRTPTDTLISTLSERSSASNKNVENEKNVKKAAIQKMSAPTTSRSGKKILSLSELEPKFKEFAADLTDDAYSDKTWDQGSALRGEDREEFTRKVRVMVNSATHDSTKPLAKKIFHEVAGFVNDRGAMQSRLTTTEAESRRSFREETGQELDEA